MTLCNEAKQSPTRRKYFAYIPDRGEDKIDDNGKGNAARPQSRGSPSTVGPSKVGRDLNGNVGVRRSQHV
jgi:hypothetical protein